MRLAQRVAADQLLYAPLNNAATILYVALAADRRSWPAARAKLAAELPGVQRRGWRLWPFVQLINQSLVPLEVGAWEGGGLAATAAAAAAPLAAMAATPISGRCHTPAMML